MNKFTVSSTLLTCALGFNPANAICVKNETNLVLHYDIQNLNMGRCSPKIKHYSGELSANSKVCFAHSREDGPDWQIYRKDRITIDTVENSGASKRACNKLVTGIINTMTVDYHPWSDTWWCLDRHDDED